MRPLAAAAALLVCTGVLSAQGTTPYPGLTVSFVAPSGIVAPADPIDVWLRLSLAPGAPSLDFNGRSPATWFGLPSNLIPTKGRPLTGAGTASFASYRNAQTTVGFSCPNGFGPLTTPPAIAPAPCGSTAYQFALNQATSGSSFSFRPTFSLLPGTSFDFLAGTFIPQRGGAPSGVYELDRLAPSINLFGADSAGRQLIASTVLVETCPTAPGPNCGFVRTVVGSAVVPEPASFALVGVGLLTGGTVAYRRRRA